MLLVSFVGKVGSNADFKFCSSLCTQQYRRNCGKTCMLYSFQHKFCRDCLVIEFSYGTLVPGWRSRHRDSITAGRSGD
jgi:hypothetical protein